MKAAFHQNNFQRSKNLAVKTVFNINLFRAKSRMHFICAFSRSSERHFHNKAWLIALLCLW